MHKGCYYSHQIQSALASHPDQPYPLQHSPLTLHKHSLAIEITWVMMKMSDG